MSSRELFESAKGGAGIMLARPKAGVAQETYLLPEDRHFSSRELLRLAIKPRAVLNLRRKGGRVAQNNDVDEFAHPADVDEQFWAQAAAAREQGIAGHGAEFEGECAYDEWEMSASLILAPPTDNDANAFNTQQYYDADDDGGFDAMGDDLGAGAPSYAYGGGEGEDELPTQALKRTRPEVVNFTKKAKRVDVRRLKDTIWKELAIDVDVLSEQTDESEVSCCVRAPCKRRLIETCSQDDDGPSTPGKTKPDVKPGKDSSRTFDAVLTGLKKAYPKDKLDEISTSYCFICLLHLANEEGLQLSNQAAVGKTAKRERAGTVDVQGSPSGAGAAGELGADHMNAMFERMRANGKGVVDDDDEGAEEEDDDEETLKVGTLDTLMISAALRT